MALSSMVIFFPIQRDVSVTGICAVSIGKHGLITKGNICIKLPGVNFGNGLGFLAFGSGDSRILAVNCTCEIVCNEHNIWRDSIYNTLTATC